MKQFLVLSFMVVILANISNAQKTSYSVHVKPIFDKYGCLGCHGGTNSLFLEPYAQVFTTGNHKPVIVPNDTNSILIQKIKGTASFGGLMPQGGPPMNPADIRTIVQWVKDGAPENPTAVRKDVSDLLIRSFNVEQNYPNPFNPSTTISFTLPQSGVTRLAVYDMLGNEIALLVNDQLSRGSYAVQFDGSALASGMYVYRLQSGTFSSVKKLMLLK